MSNFTRKDWMRILLGGFLAEASIFMIVIPIYLNYGQRTLPYSASVASLAMCFVFGLWVARRAAAQPVLQGALVGLFATVLYAVFTRFQPEPVAYLLAHCLKVLGGAAAGAIIGWKGTSIRAAGTQPQ